MRLISFFLTTPQFLNGTKTVTRRLGWKNLKPGTHLMGVRKAQGLKKGETVERLGEIKILEVSREPLQAITPEDCVREGFDGMTPVDFVEMFCRHMGCYPDTEVTRIAFKKV